MGNEKGFEAWLKLFAEKIDQSFENAAKERTDNKEALEKFIDTTFKEFLRDEYKPLEKRVIKVERIAWALGGFWVIFVAMFIWGLQQILGA